MRLRPDGNWTPAHLTRRDVTLILSLIAFLMLARGLDYMIGDDDRPLPPINGRQATTVYLSEAFPLEAWGAAILTCLVLLIVGAWCRRHAMVFLGHGLATGVYFTLFVGTLVPVLQQSYLDGVRGATPLLGMAVMHGLFAARTGPRPLRPDESVAEETIRGPQ